MRHLGLIAVVLVAGCSSEAGPGPAGAADGGSPGGQAGSAASGSPALAGSASGGVSGASGSAGAGGVTAPQAGGAGGAAAQPEASVGTLYCPPGAPPSENPLLDSPQPSVVPMAPPGGISFLEGPVWLADRGVLLFSEWNQGHRILQLTPPQAVEVFLPASRTNGLILTPDGQSLLVVTEAPATSVSRIALSDKEITPLVEAYEDESFVQPNDLAVRADGTVFFTDYQAGRLYRRASDGALSLVSSLPQSNGVGISPDEQTLYLNAGARVVAYPLAPDSSVGEGRDFATELQGADGLAIDCAGNVYIAQNQGGALVVVSPGGEPLGEFGDLPQTVTNAAFGGPERKTLYITTSSALYAVELPIAGLPY